MRYFEDSKENKKQRKLKFQECFTPISIVKEQTKLFNCSKAPLSVILNESVLEICSGEAPYLTTRYDVTNGERINVEDRCGVVDFRLKRIFEEDFSFQNIKMLYQNIFAFDIREENVKISRENLFLTLLEHLKCYNKKLDEAEMADIKDLIYKNVVQKDVFELQDNYFNIIIGNPPYNNGRFPIYHKIAKICFSKADKVSLIIPNKFLYLKTLTGDLKNIFENSSHIKITGSFSPKLFNLTMPGELITFLFDKNRIFNKETTERDKLIDKFKNFPKITEIIHTQNNFNLSTLKEDYPEYNELKDKRLITNTINFNCFHDDEGELVCYGYSKKRVTRFIKRKYIQESQIIDSYKILVPKSYGGKGIGKAIIAKPNSIYTQTYIGFICKTEQEAVLLEKYLKSDFVYSLLKLNKPTHQQSKNSWKYVPIIDLSLLKDIDDVDEFLIDYFNLRRGT